MDNSTLAYFYIIAGSSLCLYFLFDYFLIRKKINRHVRKGSGELPIGNTSLISPEFKFKFSESSFALVCNDFVLSNVTLKNKFWEYYYNTIWNYVSTAKTHIIILDYLENHKAVEHEAKQDDREKIYQNYYEKLESFVKTKKIKYTRILQLPLSKKPIINTQDLLFECASSMFFLTFQHIEKNIDSEMFELYCLEAPIKTHSLLIIDDDFILTEYNRYDKNKIAHPDTLYIDNCDNESSKKYLQTIKSQIYSTIQMQSTSQKNFSHTKKLPITPKEFSFVKENITNFISIRKSLVFEQIKDINEDLKDLAESIFSLKDFFIYNQELSSLTDLIRELVTSIEANEYYSGDEQRETLDETMSILGNQLSNAISYFNDKDKAKYPAVLVPLNNGSESLNIFAANAKVAHIKNQIGNIIENTNRISIITQQSAAKDM